MELTRQQEEFLEKFVIKRRFRRKSRADREHNRNVRDAYETFIDLRVQARGVIDAIPDDHSAVTRYNATHAELASVEADDEYVGDIDGLVASANQLIADATVFQAALRTRRQQQLDALTATAIAPDDATPEEVTEIAGMLTAGNAMLADEMPSHATIADVQAHTRAIAHRVEAIARRIGDLRAQQAAALRTALEEARTAIDSIPADHAQVPDLNAAHAEIEAVLADAGYAGDYSAEIAQATALGPRVDEVKTALRAEKQAILDRLDAAAVPPDGHSPEEVQELTALKEQGRSQLADDIPSRAEMTVAESKIAELNNKQGDIRVRQRMANLALPTDGAAADAARSALKSFDTILQGREITEELTATASAATKAANGTLASIHNRDPAPTPEEVAEARQKYLDAKKLSDAIAGTKLLAETLAPGGALTSTSPTRMSDESRTKFIEAISASPTLAGAAIDAARYSDHADAVADKIKPFAELVDKGARGEGGFLYFSPSYAEYHAGMLLKNGAFRGEEYLDGALAYVDGSSHLTDARMSVKSGDKYIQLASRRGFAVADTILKSGGDPYNLDDPSVVQAMADLNYGHNALRAVTPIHTRQVEETIETLKSEEAKERIRTAVPPTGSGATLAVELMKQVHGEEWVPPDPLTAEITQQALLVAMFNPIEQGSVGSCFATAGMITLREQDPIRAMDLYKEALEKGTFTPLQQTDDLLPPPPIPLVTEHTAGDNPITRAIEYSAASAGAALEVSSNSKRRDRCIVDAMAKSSVVEGLRDLSGDEDEALLDRLTLGTELALQTSFIYDSTAEQASTSSDGSSKFGCFVAIVGGRNVHDKDYAAGKTKFIEAAFAVAKNVYKDRLKTPEDEAALRAIVSSDEFVDSFKQGSNAIWQLAPGGMPEEVDRVLLDPASKSTYLVRKEGDPASKSEGERTIDIVAGLMTAFDGDDKNVSLFTLGQHIFNGKPTHPSQDAIRGKSKSEIEAHLIGMGDTLLAIEVPKEQAASIYDAALKSALNGVPDPHKGVAETALDSRRPGSAMTSADIDASIRGGQNAMWNAVIDALTDEQVSAWAATQGTKYDGKSVEDKKEAYAAILRKNPSRDSVRAAMAANLPMPEPILIADTNWGSGPSHTSFVIAPDPGTGEPIMWKKSDPPGSLSPAGRDWVDRDWAKTRPVG